MEAWREELYHHGIMGMKWGDRNGPPYPLRPGARSGAEKKAGTPIADKFADVSRKLKKKAAVTKAKRTRRKKAKYEHDRQEALRKGSADDILKYRGNLSNEEMETAYKRIQWENKLESLSKESRKNGMTKADKLLGNEGTIGKIKEYSGNIAGVMQNINKINKALKGDSGDEKEDKKDKKDKNKDKEKNIVINNYVNGEKVDDSSGSKPRNEQQSGKKTESSQESKPKTESKSEPDTSDVQETIDKGRSYVERNYTSLNNTESYQNYYKDKEAKESSRNEYGGIDIKRYDRYMRHSMTYLAHHGVKGMHWGIRRYQPYPDGMSGRFIGKKRRLQRALNKNDKQLSKDRIKLYRASKKLAKLKNKGANSKKIAKYDEKTQFYKKLVDEGNDNTQKLLEDAYKSKFSVTSTPFIRTVITGRDVALSVLTGGTVLFGTGAPGTDYKVSDKDKKIYEKSIHDEAVRFEKELNESGWYDKGEEIDARIEQLKRTNPQVRKLSENFDGDGSEFIWAVEYLTGDKKLKELENEAYDIYHEVSQKHDDRLRQVADKLETAIDHGRSNSSNNQDGPITLNLTEGKSKSFDMNGREITDTSEERGKAYQKAKNDNVFSGDFLEATQNDNYSDDKMLSEYKKYLDDPDKYMRTH